MRRMFSCEFRNSYSADFCRMTAQETVHSFPFFYLGFLLRTFTNDRTAGQGEGHFFNSSLPLPPASQARRHWPGDCCGELTSAHSQQPDSSREPLVSERKSLTTKLRALGYLKVSSALKNFKEEYLRWCSFMYSMDFMRTFTCDLLKDNQEGLFYKTNPGNICA